MLFDEHRCISVLGIVSVLSLGKALGQVWEPIGLQSEEVSAIAVDPRESRIIVIGSRFNISAGTPGSVFKTTDGGAQWDTVLSGLDVIRVVLHPLSSDTLFVLSGSANPSPQGILKSCDGGRTWARSDSGILFRSERVPFSMAINPVNPSVMYAGTGGWGGGEMYKSTDGGRFWSTISTSSMGGSMEAVVLDPMHPETLYVPTSGDKIWESLDGGLHWDTTLHNTSGGVDFIVDPGSSGTLYALIHYGDGGPFARSTDRGKTWVERRIAGEFRHSGNSFALDPRRRNELYAAVSTSTEAWVLKSTDSGDTWVLFSEGMEGQAPGVVCIDSVGDNIYAGTMVLRPSSLGGVWRRSLVTSVADETAPEYLQISEAYPNPFNSASLIPYSLRRRERIEVTLWDILGRQVNRIVEEDQEPGRHVVRVEGASLSSGMYLVRIDVGRRVQVRKVVLLR